MNQENDKNLARIKRETFWSTMKFLFVQVPKERLNIGYPKSSPPPNEEIKRKCLGAVAGMVCMEINAKNENKENTNE